MSPYIYQTRVCLPEDLGCVSGVDVDNEQCLERCQGIIANVMTTKKYRKANWCVQYYLENMNYWQKI